MADPPRGADPLNWLLFGELVVVVIVTSAFLFYFNRLLGSVIAFFVRLYTWRRHHAYITIGSLQISPLAGRIAFRDVEYHSSNLSIRALHGHVTFRYWWIRVKQEGDSQSANRKRKRLPCRINIFAEGLEVFVYNRTPAYDAIVERMKKHERENAQPSTSSMASSAEDNPIKVKLRSKFKHAGKEDLQKLDSSSSSEPPEKPDTHPEQPAEALQTNGVDWFREMLPVELRIETGSLILGSDATPMILIGDFKRADGFMEVTESRSLCDQYRFLVDLSFQQPTVLYRSNLEWSGHLLAHGKKVYDELVKRDAQITKQPPSKLSMRATFHQLARRFAFLQDPVFSRPPRAGLPQDKTWRGLARYRDGSAKDAPKHEREYAKVTTILESPRLDFTYFADTPGRVPHPSEVAIVDEADELGNVDLPPEYGMDLVIHGGMVKYGPWADRQRDWLQRTFAPSIFFDTEPKARLRPGDTRLHANLVLNVQFSEETYLRIPTREPSKDWQYDGHPEADLTRRYGWLDITTGANSSIVYTQSQFATAHGYDSMAVLHLDSLTIASSVNLQSFVRAQACKVSLAMPSPLQWDAQRDWGLDLTLESPDITLLRDHITLISDLAKDWSSGYVGDFHHFVPNHYNFRVRLSNYAVHLYINDSNIVDQPQSRDANAFMDLCGPSLTSYVAVDSTRYRPEFSTIPFSVALKDARVEIGLPRYDTHRSFSDFEALEVGKIGTCSVDGTYVYYARAHPDHQETLNLRLEARNVAFHCLGWALRRLFCVKDNYFGMFTQFTTTQEYLERFDHDPKSVGDPVEEKWRPGRSDAMATHISMDVQDSVILLSDEIYASNCGLVLPVPQLQMSLKSVEAFMELSIDVPPTYIVAAPNFARVYEECSAPSPASNDTVFLEGLELKANRLFGPQPRAATYLCLWEAVIPKLSVFASPAFIATLRRAVAAVAFNFSDKENAPTAIYIPETPPDVTFFKLNLNAASIALYAGNSAVLVDLPSGINLDTSTLATLASASSLGVHIPAISATMLSRASNRLAWTPCGSMHTGVSVDIYKAPQDWHDEAARQQTFLRQEDELTQRIWYMYREGGDSSNGHHANALYLPRPRVDVDPDDYETDDSTSDLASSSGSGSSTREKGRFSAPNAKRGTSRSFTTARESVGDDTDDESGEISSVASSGSSDSSPRTKPSGMASILADRHSEMSYMRSHSVEDRGRSHDPSLPVEGKLPRASCGTVIRVASKVLRLDGSTESAACMIMVLNAMSKEDARPTQILDSLLDKQVDDFYDRGVRPVPLTLDITLPRLHVSITTDNAEQSSRLALDIRQVSIQHAKSGSHSGKSAFATSTIIAKSVRTSLLSTSGKRPLVSLADTGEGHDDPQGFALFRFDALGISVTMSQNGTQKAITTNITSSDLKFVSPVFRLAQAMANRWSNIIFALPRADKTPSPAAKLIAGLLRVVSIHPESSLAPPSFAAELTYGLHVSDDRSLRRDHGWRVLAQLRKILLDESSVPKADSPDQNQVYRQLSALDWIPGEGGEDLMRKQTFVRAAGLSSAGELEADGDLAIFLSVDNLILRHFDRLLGSGRIGASMVRFGPVSAGLYRAEADVRGRAESQIRALLAIQSIDVEIQDSIFAAVRQLLATSQPAKTDEKPVVSTKGVQVLISLDLNACELAILAGGLRLVASIAASSAVFTHRNRLEEGSDGIIVHGKNNLVMTSQRCKVSLLQPTDDQNPSNSANREVMIVMADDIKVISHAVGSTQAMKRKHVAVAVKSVLFDSRPTLRRFLDFAQTWQDKHYPHYKPLVEQLRVTLAKNPAHVPKTSPAPGDLVFDLAVDSAVVSIRAARTAWLGWHVGRIYACSQGSTKSHSFGIRAQPQNVGFYSSKSLTRSKDTVRIDLPAVNVDGQRSTARGMPRYDVRINLGRFDSIVKPTALDRFLSVYKSLAPEARQLLRDYGSYARSLFNAEDTPSTPTSLQQAALFRIDLSIEGISIGLRADDVATTLLFRSLKLKGHATNEDNKEHALTWRAGAPHFEISLGQISLDTLSSLSEDSRRYKSAYMQLDVGAYEVPSDTGAPSQLGVSLSRVQTFMHIAALSEVSDLISSWTSDLHVLTDKRAEEVAEVRERTSKFLKKIDTSDKGVQPEASWFATRLLTVEISSFGVAVPLGSETAIDLRQQADAVVPALLWSIRSISFQNRRNETARFRVQHIGLQFVSEFNHNVAEHFAGEFHSSFNRMSLPLIDSEAQMSSKPDAWTLSANCLATDFNLSLDPHVVDGIFQLIDLYERGKDHIAHLDKRYRTELVKKEIIDTVAATHEVPDSPVSGRPKQQIVVRLSFTFDSGRVQLHRLATNGQERSPIRGRGLGWHDEVTLPGISLWIDYAGPKRVEVVEDGDGAGFAIFNAAVHQSFNKLKPSILPFFVQLAGRVEARVRAKDRRRSSATSQPTQATPSTDEPAAQLVQSESTLSSLAKASAGVMRLRFTLRIDRSELRLSCSPDSQAYFSLRWESGGFVASSTIGSEEISTVAGTISGVSTNLSHEFDQERSCIEAGARDLTFSVSYDPSWRDKQGGVSIVLDTKISAQFRLELFSAWLTFISVWVDNAPSLDVSIMAAIGDPAAPTPIPPPTSDRKKIGIAVLARIQAIDFEADIAVSHAKLQISPIVLHTLSDGLKTKVDLLIGKTEITAHGDISGTIFSDSIDFHTSRKSSRASDASDPQLLTMTINGGDLGATIFLGGVNIVRFSLAPSSVSLSDDWKDARAAPLLSFRVDAGKMFMVVRLLSIPGLLGKVYKILEAVEFQHRIATQRSETFKNRQIRRHNTPSPIATALLQTMQKTANAPQADDAAVPSDLRIAQSMQFQLAGIDIGIFNEDFGEGHILDFYRFIIGAVHADLKRVPGVFDGEDRPFRDLKLAVGYIRWDHTDGRRAVGEEKKDLTAEQMIVRAVKTGRREVASLPSMSLTMDSDEHKGPTPTLKYHFTLVWGGTDGDIAILPNFFEQAYKSMKKVIAGIEREEIARARRLGAIKMNAPRREGKDGKRKEGDKGSEKDKEKERDKSKEKRISQIQFQGPREAETLLLSGNLHFEPRDPAIEVEPPIPTLKILGEGTRDVANMVPRFKEGIHALPKLSHLFVTAPLEEAMDLLLKLYEKQLPDKMM